jgi:hypothetical protein
LRIWLLAGLVLLGCGAARAGPPFVTDDPEPTDTGHWEIYNYAQGAGTPGALAGSAGLDLNYGGAKDLQLTATIPVVFQTGASPGLGDIELAVKYRFLHQSAGSVLPDVAFFPRLSTPSGGLTYGTGRPQLLAPLWAQKDFGAWSLFGGGGYTLNPGAGQRNYWISGAALTRTITPRFSLGAEVYHQTPTDLAGRDFTGINLGALYRFTPHWSFIGAGGPGVQNPREGGDYDFYVALKADY